MAIIDDIQAVDIEEQAKVNSDRAANSIRFRPESAMMTKNRYFKFMHNMAKRDEAMQQLKEVVKKDVEENVEYDAIIGRNLPYGAKIVKLEDSISILNFEQPPMMLIGNRAIRLIDKMYKEVMATSNSIYAEQMSNNKKLVVTSDENKNLENNLNIDVQKIAEENKNVIDKNIENAISEEKTLEENNIKEIVSVDYDIDEESKNIINEKIEDFVNGEKDIEKVTEPIFNPTFEEENMEDKSTDEQTVDHNMLNPVLEDEIAKAREIEQVDKYNTINEEAVRTQEEVAKTNELKEFDFSVKEEPIEQALVDVPTIIDESSFKDEAIRDEIITVPERDEIVSKKEYVEPGVIKENFITKEEVKPIFIKIGNEEPVSLDMPADVKMKAQEIMKKVRAERKRKEELAEENSKIVSDIETQKELNAQVAVLEDESKKRLEKSTIELEQAKQDYIKAINDKEKEYAILSDENNATMDIIQSGNEELASIQEDTASKNKEIENLDIENKSIQDEIANYKELIAIINENADDNSIEFQKVV